MRIINFLLTIVIATTPVGAIENETPPSVETVAGTGSHGYTDGDVAQFNLPSDIFFHDGQLYVADTFNNLIRSVDADGYVQTEAGRVAVVDASGFPRGFMLDGDIDDVLFNRPSGIAVDGRGRIFVADTQNNVIRMISQGTVSTFAEGFNHPTAIAFGPCGNLFVADTLNHVIRRVSPSGRVNTVAGTVGVAGFRNGAARQSLFNEPMGIAVADDGTVYVADTGNNLIRTVRRGQVRALAGQRILSDDTEDAFALGGFADGEDAMFSAPMGLALWGETLFVADSANHSIRMVAPDGEVTTLFGTGYPGYIDGLLDEAELHFPSGVFVFENTLYIADTGNNLIRFLPLENEEGEQ